MTVRCEAGWGMRKRRRRGSSNRGSKGGGARCSRRELQKIQLVERHHKRRCKQRTELGGEGSLCHMGGGGLTVSHPASATIVV